MKHFNFSAFSRNDLNRAGVAVFLIALLFSEPLAISLTTANDKKNKAAKMKPDQRIAHILSRISFGARPEDFEKVKEIGVEKYIEQQLDPDSLDDSGLDARLSKLSTLSLATPNLISKYNPPKPVPLSPAPSPTPLPSPSPAPNSVAPNDPATKMEMTKKTDEATIQAAKQMPGNETTTPVATAKPKPTPAPPNPQQVVTELQRAKLLRAVYSERQLNEVLIDFWENHFSIYAQKDADRWLLTSFDRDTVRPNALGRFRDLLGATAKSPAMLFYLDNWQSSVLKKYPAEMGKPARQTGGINENYARELMELHTLGVDGGYTQRDVQEVARCFTGWTIYKPNEIGLFMFNPLMHDAGEKTVLGQKIPAGGGISDGERVLDILAKQPATAKFIATKLARRLVGDNPPPSIVNQGAKVFLQTDGSIRETLRAILTAPEFFAPSAYRAKIRSPFEYAAASLRLLKAETDADRPLLDWIGRMGEPTFGRVTPDGFPEKSSEWLSTNDLLARFNFASALATNKIKGTRIDYKQLLASAEPINPQTVTAQLVRIAFINNISAQTQTALEKVVQNAAAGETDSVVQKTLSSKDATINSNTNLAVQPKTENPPNYVGEIVTLIVGSREFQTR